MQINHVVVLMLENRSFDSMLGMLYPSSATFDGLIGTENNIWHKPDGSTQTIQVWTDPASTSQSLCCPNPDPGELFTDIQMQLHGLSEDGKTLNPGPPTMGGFVDNYMRQNLTAPGVDPHAVMHYFTPNAVPVISQLARAFGVSDRWFASAPCQTWPNRFFAHTGTAGGRVNNSPTYFPYTMETVFNRLSGIGQNWHIYFHDIPHTATLAQLWGTAIGHFHHFDADFANDAATGRLPAYSFIEPRYFADTVFNKPPNDQHPPHNIAYGEQLIATIYNALRSGPGWKQTLFIITYDEHGGCFDHVPPPAATKPGGNTPDGFDFGQFGVRVPAVIVSPYVRPGRIIRPPGATPFDHTSIIATLRALYPFAPLTPRDQAAPDLLGALGPTPDNDGPAAIVPPVAVPTARQVATSAAQPQNGMQRSLSSAAVQLPAAGANVAAHIAGLVASPKPTPSNAADAGATVIDRMKAFLGKP